MVYIIRSAVLFQAKGSLRMGQEKKRGKDNHTGEQNNNNI